MMMLLFSLSVSSLYLAESVFPSSLPSPIFFLLLFSSVILHPSCPSTVLSSLSHERKCNFFPRSTLPNRPSHSPPSPLSISIHLSFRTLWNLHDLSSVREERERVKWRELIYRQSAIWLDRKRGQFLTLSG